jgi:hypothetical protein
MKFGSLSLPTHLERPPTGFLGTPSLSATPHGPALIMRKYLRGLVTILILTIATLPVIAGDISGNRTFTAQVGGREVTLQLAL